MHMRVIPVAGRATVLWLSAMLIAGTAGGQSIATVTRGEVTVHDARWQPWLGCWKPTGAMTPVVSAGESISAAAPTMLCIVPGSTTTSVEVVNFSGGSITERTVIDPGQATAKKVDDCTGQETATWSADGRRVLLRGTFNCGRGVTRVESGVMSIDADGQWVQAQSVKVGGNVTTFVAEFRDTGIALEGIRNGAIVERPILDESGKRLSPPRDGCTGSEAVKPSSDGQRVMVQSDYTCVNGLHRVADAEFARSNRGEWVRTNGAGVLFSTPSVRAAAGAPVTTDDVLEVAKLVDATVAEAWFSSRQQGFDLTGKELVRLADAGMPSRVIDMMVAVSNPKTFVVRRNDGTTDADGRAIRAPRASDRRIASDARGCSLTQDYCYGMMGLGWLYGADRYYGWSPYGYQYGSRYGYGYGYPTGGGYWGPGYYNGNGPIVVVTRPSAPAEPRGRAVYGQGYTRDKPITYSAPTSTSSGSGGTSSAGSGSSGGSSSGSSGGGEARTAKPRPPGAL
ncbi:MAG: hypothetical protein IPP90_18500 [Gemmatimonadaceae bacterium]|nr:hypothetical protein [Gemmatimonadaceae bacterium]